MHAVPSYTTVVYVGTTPYYYAGGTYYVATQAPAPQPPSEVTQAAADDTDQVEMIEDDHNFEVVGPPVGATVPYLPEEADEVEINGKKYSVYDGTYYQAFVNDGDTIYMIVEDPKKACT